MQAPSVTACMIVIGNEILSGRTQDKNIGWIARQLNEIGIRLAEARIIPDSEEMIVETVNRCRTSYDYVFTSGGIGPTHDDITSASIAKAFGVTLVRHSEAEAILQRHYGPDQLNAARLKMADIPQGGTLIPNPVSAAPGFCMENVFVMAGVPSIMQAMFDHVKPLLKGGPSILSRTLSAYVTEGMIAEPLARIQEAYPNVDIGSYPFIRQQRLGTSLVARSQDTVLLDAVYLKLKELLLSKAPEIEEGEAV